MAPVACRECGAQVLVRKSSWNQTSVQWNAEATARCAQRREAHQVLACGDRSVFLVCSALGDAIADSVRQGRLVIVDAPGHHPVASRRRIPY